MMRAWVCAAAAGAVSLSLVMLGVSVLLLVVLMMADGGVGKLAGSWELGVVNTG